MIQRKPWGLENADNTRRVFKCRIPNDDTQRRDAERDGRTTSCARSRLGFAPIALSPSLPIRPVPNAVITRPGR